MLILTRKIGDDIYLDGEIRLVIKEIKGKQVRVGIEAPAGVGVYRGEIYRQLQDENQKASQFDLEDVKWAVDILNQEMERNRGEN